MLRILIATILTLTILSPAAIAGDETVQLADSPRLVIAAYIKAFNAQDVAGMAEYMHPDVEWFDIAGDEMRRASAGREALVAEMEAYFSFGFETVSTLSGVAVKGSFVSGVETVAYTDSSGTERVQASTVVYELEDHLVRRVWYFAALTTAE